MSNEVTDFERKFEDLDEDGLLRMLPTVIAERVKAIPQNMREMTEDDLERAGKIGETEQRLRTAFWLEYERAKRTKKPMMAANVFAGTCTQAYFYHHVVSNSYKLAYICLPPIEVQIALEEMLLFGLKELRKILALPNLNEKGFVDARLIDVKRKIVVDAADRRRGHVLRKTEVQTKSLNVNLNADMHTPDIKDVDARLAELEAEYLPAPKQSDDIISQVQAIDVEAEEVREERESST